MVHIKSETDHYVNIIHEHSIDLTLLLSFHYIGSFILKRVWEFIYITYVWTVQLHLQQKEHMREHTLIIYIAKH